MRNYINVSDEKSNHIKQYTLIGFDKFGSIITYETGLNSHEAELKTERKINGITLTALFQGRKSINEIKAMNLPKSVFNYNSDYCMY